jgi:hypothetical protein
VLLKKTITLAVTVSMHANQDVKAGRFSYKPYPSDSAIFYIVLAVLSGGGVPLILFIAGDRSLWLAAVAMPFVLVLRAVYVLTQRRYSDIVIDPSGISRCIGSRVLKTVRWSEVKLVRFNTLVVGRPPTLLYVLDRKTGGGLTKGRGAVSFQKNALKDVRRLIELMNHYISEFNIPVEDWHPSPHLRLNLLPVE